MSFRKPIDWSTAWRLAGVWGVTPAEAGRSGTFESAANPSGVGIVLVDPGAFPDLVRSAISEPKMNVLSLMMGPPMSKPAWLRLNRAGSVRPLLFSILVIALR